MRLFFMRHGHAEPLASSDEERALTPDGFRRIQNAAEVMRRLDLSLTHIYSSPRVRARQTAETVAGALGLTVEVHEAVNFGFDLAAVRDLSIDAGEGPRMLFVGHQPTLSAIIGDITGANAIMKPGSLARIDISSRQLMRGELVWLIAPKVFDALATSDVP